MAETRQIKSGRLREVVLCVLLLPWITPAVQANSAGPLPQFTGGFGELTCVACHVGHSPNEGRARGGIFHVLGIPETYSQGESYPIRVVIGQPGQSRWGFELSARHAASGNQAGRLVPVDGRTTVTQAAGIQYIHHTAEGSAPGIPNGPVEFEFHWIAPDPMEGPVYFNAAGNAADGSFDERGDFIYTAGGFSGLTADSPVPAAPVVRRRPVQRLRTSSRLMHIPIPADLNRGTTEIHIEHRFLQPLAGPAPSRAGPGTGFGIDSGANIMLAINYALTDQISAGVSRTRNNQIVSFVGTYEVPELGPEGFWRSSVVGGVEGQRNFRDPDHPTLGRLGQYSPYLQLTNSFDVGPVRAYLMPMVIWNSRRDRDVIFGDPAVHPEHNSTYALGLGADVALHHRLSLSAEYVPRLGGFGGLGEKHHPSLAWGVQIRTWNHVFTIMLANSRDFTPSQYAVEAQNNFVLGFNIYRRMR